MLMSNGDVRINSKKEKRKQALKDIWTFVKWFGIGYVSSIVLSHAVYGYVMRKGLMSKDNTALGKDDIALIFNNTKYKSKEELLETLEELINKEFVE